jgi:hypothetical protein
MGDRHHSAFGGQVTYELIDSIAGYAASKIFLRDAPSLSDARSTTKGPPRIALNADDLESKLLGDWPRTSTAKRSCA